MLLSLRERFRSLGKNWAMEEIGCMDRSLLDASEIVLIYKNMATRQLDTLPTIEMLAYCYLLKGYTTNIVLTSGKSSEATFIRTAPTWLELDLPPGGITDAARKVGSAAMFSKSRNPFWCRDRINVRMESMVLADDESRGAAERLESSMILWSPVDLIINYRYGEAQMNQIVNVSYLKARITFLMTRCHPPCYLSASVLDSSQLSDRSCLFDVGKFE